MQPKIRKTNENNAAKANSWNGSTINPCSMALVNHTRKLLVHMVKRIFFLRKI